MNVSLSPTEGPSGTTTTINISRAPAGAPVTLYINGGITSLTADANGNASTTHTVFGGPEQVVNFKAEAGTAPPFETASAQFKLK